MINIYAIVVNQRGGVDLRKGYIYNSKMVREGIVDKVKRLKDVEGKKFPEIAEICGMKSRQHAYEVYCRANSHKY